MRYHVRGALLVIVVVVVMMTVGCAADRPRESAQADTIGAGSVQYVVLDAVASRALVWETQSNMIGLVGHGGASWPPDNLRSRYSACVDDCSSAVFSSDIARWRENAADSDPVVFSAAVDSKIDGAGQRWTHWLDGRLKRRVLWAESASDYLALVRGPIGNAEVVAVSPNSTMSVPLHTPIAYWVPFPEGDGGLVYERGEAGGRVYLLIRQDGRWISFQKDVPFEVFYACGSRGGDTVVVAGSAGAFFLNDFSGADATLIETDLRHVGECYFTSVGVVLSERSNSTRDGTTTRLRHIDWSGVQTWDYDGRESLFVSASPASPDVFVSGRENVVKITSTGTVESLGGDTAGVGYTRSGEVIRIGGDGRVSR